MTKSSNSRICFYDCILGVNLEQGLVDSSRGDAFSIDFKKDEEYLKIPAKGHAKIDKGDSAHTM